MEINVIELLKKIKEDENAQVSNYLENEHRIFAIYTLQQRAIPYFNGLKPVQQRILWKTRTQKDFEKVAKLTGMVMSIHPHGDASISEAISQMTGPFCNNEPFFDGDGAFGTKIAPTSFGQARYISARQNNFTKDVVFRDWEIVEMIPTYDEKEEEPYLLLPLVPVLLLNGIQGIATGYSTYILPRDLKDLIDRQILHLQGKEIDNPLPYSKPIDNRAVRDDDNPNKYYFFGEVEILDTSKARITKLPFGMSHADLLKKLSKLIEKHKIRDYVDKSRKEIDIVVTFKKSALKGKKPEHVIRTLGLYTSATERIVVLEPNNSKTIEEYNAVEFIKDYTDWRLSFYPKRYKRLIKLNEEEIKKLNDIIVAIENDLGKKARDVKNKSELKIICENLGICDTEYISSLPLYRFTIEEYEKTKNRIAELEKEIEEYKKIIADIDLQKRIYIDELKEIRKKYCKQKGKK